ncbi:MULTISPECIES: CDP-glycerol glycerophosphotransferase family protein [Bacillus cereus group]|uniref:CDP-glycerol glycerophosphotransferase family protein n=1 Tax=Bacillus cereus group TaxID=86661 RepID=UPI00065FBAFE|nr:MULTISPECIES: CDP-glycerol glycerophosphotransferase family protein [Bacillus cereus group]AWC34613.1 CDP-glycerol glycerophosphotransferase family protein [Bacillus cytotoxicus]AWC38609.1 CDP-glycerol glycerophosphotransferase family protein [Bacillus cytotoxicus]AWC62827.1 CDP-glycerol glycerophosphotransferase family protein [Bacillus cytotoxicus]KMT49632.1 CDP-glycerol:glycerophosphate glycerophosphotransferase [Bacillus cytotoxicus]QTR79858.1 CDP-glycerol glycerophosphotransferase fami
MSFVKRIKNHYIVKKICKVIFIFCSCLPPKKKLILFESYAGKQYSCNPRAIYEYIVRNNMDFQIVWSVNKNHTKQFDKENISYVKRFSIRWFILLARARYWVVNSRMPLWLPKPKHTIYVQTWHGTPLKKLAGDMKEVHMPGTTTEKYKHNFHREAQNWDYLLSPNEYSTEIFKRAFQFKKNIVEIGYPRNDFLYINNNSRAINTLKKKNGLPVDKKIILYAPTWRDDQFYSKGRYKLDLQLDLSLLQKRLGSDYIVLLRMHYLVAEQFNLEPYKGFVYDFSKHVDINELYVLSDLLITDYSSVFFDYANLKRPIIFYTYDIDSYRDKLRGFYFDLETEVPGPVVLNTEEVIEEILRFEKNGLDEFAAKYDNFYNKYCYLEDGFASKRVVERIFFREA